MFPIRDDNPKRRPAFVMWLIGVLNILVFGAMFLREDSYIAFEWVTQYGLIPDDFFRMPIAQGSDLISHMFLHGSLAHIAGNMFFLWVFGDNVEDEMGHGRFLAFYLAGGIVAGLSHGLVVQTSEVPMVGASGAISAVLGAYFVFFPRHRVLTYIFPFFFRWLPVWLYLGVWTVMQLVEAFSGLVGSNVAWWAHLGGFAFGVVMGMMMKGSSPPSPPSQA